MAGSQSSNSQAMSHVASVGTVDSRWQEMKHRVFELLQGNVKKLKRYQGG